MVKLIDYLPAKLKVGLSRPEEMLLDVVPEGTVANYRVGDERVDNPENSNNWGADRTIRAELLSWLCVNPQATPFIHFKGVHIEGARIAGDLDFFAATVPYPLAMKNCAIENIFLVDAKTRSLNFNDSVIGAITADGLATDGRIFLQRIKAKGDIRLLGATINGSLSCQKASFNKAKEFAFGADSLNIKGNVFLREVTAIGEVRLTGADISGDLDCSRATFENAEGNALNIDHVAVKGRVVLMSIKAKGNVQLIGANIQGDLSCNAAIFESNDDFAFTADRANVKGNVAVNKVKAKGEVRLSGAIVGGDLNCQETVFENPEGHAFVGEKMRINGTMIINNLKNLDGAVTLTHAFAGQLVDDVSSWPKQSKLYLDGFEYSGLPGAETPKTASERIKWLRLQPKQPFYSQPYEQLAKVFKAMGRETDARKVLIAKHDDLYKFGNLSRSSKIWHRFLGYTIGYGYQTWKVLLIMLLFLLVGWGIFFYANILGVMQPSKESVYLDRAFIETQKLPSQYPKFNSFVYSLETLVPFLNLHQGNYWLPDATKPEPTISNDNKLWGKSYGRWIRIYLWVHIVLGWASSTLAVVSLTGLVRKE